MQVVCTGCGEKFEGNNFSKYCSPECGGFQVFQGQKYYRLSNGYYMGNNRHMHVDVWEFYNGKRPENQHIHHIDHDRSNNDIQNLECLSKKKHKEKHLDEQRARAKTPEGKARTEKMRLAGIEWLATEEGRKFRKEQMTKMRASQRLIDKACEYCGKSFQTKENFAKFCSRYCYHTKRRKDGIDDVEKTCLICGLSYKSRKYIKSHTCSDRCRGIYRAQERPKIEKICRNCKKTFFSTSHKSVYCRSLCGVQWRRKGNKCQNSQHA
jgi:hypothetical protein